MATERPGDGMTSLPRRSMGLDIERSNMPSPERPAPAAWIHEHREGKELGLMR
jgi:hypothetical protein